MFYAYFQFFTVSCRDQQSCAHNVECCIGDLLINNELKREAKQYTTDHVHSGTTRPLHHPIPETPPRLSHV